MSRFLLLLRGGEFADYSEAEMQAIIQKYVLWTENLKQEGRHIASEPLENTGRIMKTEGEQVVDGPFTETKEAIGGFYMITADDYDEAVKIARDCPHLDYRGTIELREVKVLQPE